jgi:hypothetical protein
MSISKAQAEALAEGFLDSIGSDRDGLFLKGVYSEAIVLAGELIEQAQHNLVASNSVSSGALSQSLIASDPRVVGSTMYVDIYMNFYGRFVNKGVKGTKAGGSLAGYSFKYDMPGKKMLAAIAEYTKRGHITTRTVTKNRGYGSHERKQKRLSQLTDADRVFAMARSIKQKGIKATGFLDAAIRVTQTKVADRLGAQLKIDIINSIQP